MDLRDLGLIADIQETYPGLILCGSAALILLDVLPNREMSDIDFVTSKKHVSLIKRELDLSYDRYNDLNVDDKYSSYSVHLSSGHKINILAFDDDVKLYSDTISIIHLGKIRHQKLEDIINWKEKYNRSKDIEDLEQILNKAIETSIL